MLIDCKTHIKMINLSFAYVPVDYLCNFDMSINILLCSFKSCLENLTQPWDNLICSLLAYFRTDRLNIAHAPKSKTSKTSRELPAKQGSLDKRLTVSN